MLDSVPTRTVAVKLIWYSTANNAGGFVIERRPAGGGAFAPIATVPATQTIYTDFAVQPGLQYFYRVAAYNLSGGSLTTGTLSGSVTQTGGTISTSADDHGVDLTGTARRGRKTRGTPSNVGTAL